MSIYHLLLQEGKLEELAHERLRQQAKHDGTMLQFQLSKFGVCPCSCHTGDMLHVSHPCCLQARMRKSSAGEQR
jgi:hypothetical protein